MKQRTLWGRIKKAACLLLCVGLGLVESTASVRAVERTKEAEEKEVVEEEERESQEKWLKEQLSRKQLSREAAASYIYEYLCAAGEVFPEDKIQRIIKYHRIWDFSKVSKERREALAGVYALGILTGESCGEYTHQRKLFPKSILSESEKAELYEKTLNAQKRTPISYDGQVIRTDNLPKQAKYYSYILESFPNEYYDDPFGIYYDYNRFLHKAGEDFFYPVQMLKKSMAGKVDWYVNSYGLAEAHEQYSCDWVELVEKNLNLRLNFDYRTVDEKWMNELLNTYAGTKGNSETRREERKRLEEYVKIAKKNHIVIQGKGSTDMSCFYSFGGFKLRVYVKFRVLNADNLTPDLYDHEKVIYGNRMSLHGLREGKWEESFFDFWVGSHGYGGYWTNFGIMDDSFVRYAKPEHYRKPE